MAKKLRLIFLFFTVFGLLSVPILWSFKATQVVDAPTQFPQEKRHIASVLNNEKRSCQTKKRWRWVCSENGTKESCKKDQIQEYKICH